MIYFIPAAGKTFYEFYENVKKNVEVHKPLSKLRLTCTRT